MLGSSREVERGGSSGLALWVMADAGFGVGAGVSAGSAAGAGNCQGMAEAGPRCPCFLRRQPRKAGMDQGLPWERATPDFARDGSGCGLFPCTRITCRAPVHARGCSTRESSAQQLGLDQFGEDTRGLIKAGRNAGGPTLREGLGTSSGDVTGAVL